MAEKSKKPSVEDLMGQDLVRQYTQVLYCGICGKQILWFGPSAYGPAASSAQKNFEQKFKVHYECFERQQRAGGASRSN